MIDWLAELVDPLNAVLFTLGGDQVSTAELLGFVTGGLRGSGSRCAGRGLRRPSSSYHSCKQTSQRQVSSRGQQPPMVRHGAHDSGFMGMPYPIDWVRRAPHSPHAGCRLNWKSMSDRK